MNPFQKLAAKAQSAKFRFKADVDKGDLIDGEKQTGGLKVMTVVIFVLAAHIVVIGGITAYNLLKGPPKDTAQTATPATDGLATDGDKTDGTDKSADAPKPADADMAKDGTATKDDGTATTASAPAANDASSSEAINLAPATANGDNSAPDAAATPATQAPAQAVPASKPMVQATVPPVAAPAPATAPVAVVGARQSYVVKSGDNLHKIAVTHGMTVAQLKAVNGLKGDMIRVGQKLTVVAKGTPAVAVAQVASTAPAAAPVTPASAMVSTIAQATPAAPAVETTAPAPVSTSAVAATTSSQSYKVAKGDTLTRIAKQFKTTASAIMAANKLSDPKKLRIGETLVIPAHADHREISSQQAVPATLPNQPSANPDLVMNK